MNTTSCIIDEKINPFNFTTYPLNCGEKIRSQFKEVNSIVLIQSNGSSTVNITMQLNKVSKSKSKAIIILISVFMILAVAGAAIYFLERYRLKKNLSEYSI